jgi:hypothetical protein
LVLVDDVVEGTLALPIEREAASVESMGPFAADPFGQSVRVRTRPGFCVEPLAIAWNAVAFRLRGSRDGVACIPRAALAEFLDALDAGELDATIHRFLASPPQGRVLQASEQTERPGLFDELSTPGAIAARERVPGRPRRGGRGGGTPRDSRRDKNRRSRGPRRALLAAGAVVVVVAAVIFVLMRDDTSTVRSTGDGGTPIGAVPVKFDVAFTVESVTVGPHYTGDPVPTLGSRVTLPVLASCTTTCTFADSDRAPSASPFVDLGLPFTATSPDFLQASSSSSDSSSPCTRVSGVREEISMRLTRDATGAVSGFTGRFQVTHPNGVEETTSTGTCSTFDISYSFVGTRA